MAGTRKPVRIKEAAMTYVEDLTRVVQLRAKNQITLPREVADQIGARPGDRFVIDALAEPQGEVRLRKLPRSLAGTLDGAWGSHEQVIEYLREERASWGE
jgi:bifunctional DNA-binding transcriptional regulator/antitoxin component of YhaV-PrlF toxin-antitoxin module